MELKIMSLVEESTMLSARLESSEDETDSKREQNLSQVSIFKKTVNII